MKFKTLVSTSILALGLVACGSGDDNSKPEDKDKLPEKSQECKDAGELCKLVDGKWVIEKKDVGKKPDGEKPPVADSAFDYSDIGVTDTLEPEKRGFGFWHKGDGSRLNAKTFKNNPTQSPIIQWSSKLNYDVDLWNFVAITLDNGEKTTKNQIKFMFDNIGEENQKQNKNVEFFGKPTAQTKIANKGYGIGRSSLTSANAYLWNVVPALVNTFMYRDKDGKWNLYYGVADRKVFLHQEEDTNAKLGSGKVSTRVYGVNAFLSATDAHVLKLDGSDVYNPSKPEDKYNLATRTDKQYLKHPNFVWYDYSTLGKRTGKAFIEDPTGTPLAKTALDDLAKKITAKEEGVAFPTDIKIGQLKYTQFGRMTGEGIDPGAESIQGYTDKSLKPYNFSGNSSAAAGNDKAEDWYFARGTEPAPQAVLDNLKKAGKPVVYDGQAVMFGIDYDPRKPVAKVGSESPASDKPKESTNAVKPAAGKPAGADYSKITSLFDGKQNFVRMVWNPENGEVKGSVYGVWTQASYYRANKDFGTASEPKKGDVLVLALDSTNTKIEPDKTSGGITLGSLEHDEKNDAAKVTEVEKVLNTASIMIAPYVNQLVMLDGKVIEGTNSFGGAATRVKDESKGLFQGAFFGRDASEIGGVIDSQTGDFKDAEMVDPAAKWGGSFGAQARMEQGVPVDIDLGFKDPTIDYGTSLEFFNVNP